MKDEEDPMRWLDDPLPTPGAHTAARVHAGELDEPVDPARLAELEAERRAFLTRRPTSAFTAAIEARRRRRRLRWGGLLTFGLTATAAAAALLMVPVPPPEAAGPSVRLKAGVGLSFHVRSGGEVTDGQPGGTYHPGDAIQLRYTSGRHDHLVVVSLDSAGTVTAFYDAAGRSLPVTPGVGRLLDGSVVLDDALGPEAIFGCFSDAPIDTEAVRRAGVEALRSAGGDPAAVRRLDVACDQARLLIHKARRPPD